MKNQDTQKIIKLLEAQGKVLEEHGKKFDEHEEILHFICETMGTTMVTKDDLKAFATKEEMKNGFKEVESQLSAIRMELAGMRRELDDIKLSLKKLENKTQEDDNAMIFEIEELKKRVAVLERELVKARQMQPA
ncbi:MAG: hypothetical protein HZC05_01495 [Candidatus Magasanikbacteria bacterium]|nr:hypothetical protein [Candidatus Magasanikbacteria bacterium]